MTFTDGGNVFDGICNGEPKCFDETDPMKVTHVPVYVHDTDKCMIVGVANLVNLSVSV